MHRSGFVNIVGNPNVGKSTLMNALVGERLSIITSKAQTTRHRIMGIVNGEDFQIVYSDTPGVLKPNYKLQEQMLDRNRIHPAKHFEMLYVTDVQDTPDKNAEFLEKVKKISEVRSQKSDIRDQKTKVFLVINKIDLTTPETLDNLVAYWQKELPEAAIYPISAKEKFGIDQLFNAIKDALPECPPFFPKDQLTDKSSRFFVNEIIREKILLCYDKEIPYSTEVEVDSFKEVERLNAKLSTRSSNAKQSTLHICATIYVERESQKGIIIGHKGAALKKVGMLARKDIEAFFDKPVYLELFVKVDRDWRSSTSRLKHYGYDLS